MGFTRICKDEQCFHDWHQRLYRTLTQQIIATATAAAALRYIPDGGDDEEDDNNEAFSDHA